MYKPFMTDWEFITRLREDLKDAEFMAFDLVTPTNEEEYQDELAECQMLVDLATKRRKESRSYESK